jgi:hypothetical protein
VICLAVVPGVGERGCRCSLAVFLHFSIGKRGEYWRGSGKYATSRQLEVSLGRDFGKVTVYRIIGEMLYVIIVFEDLYFIQEFAF